MPFSVGDLLTQLCQCILSQENIAELMDPSGAQDRRTGRGDLNSLDDLLQRGLMSIRGRRNLFKDQPLPITPTTFDDVDDPPSEDEDGEEVSVLAGGVFAGQHYEVLKQKCLEQGTPFVDPMFPPCPASLYATARATSATNFDDIEWFRATDLVPEGEMPGFFVDGYSRDDINQGELGDCWFLAAVANLTQHKKLFEKVVPVEQNFTDDYAGIFHFRFWQYGEWVDVVVDDYLPTRNGELLYVRSDSKKEFWSALMEKAYAKLHGSYEALKGGNTAEASVDFSGGISEQYDVAECPQFYDILMKGFDRHSMMSCSIDPDPTTTEARLESGLVRGHAYSVTKILKAKIDTGNKQGLFPLVRIRNPWGNDAEWRGAWSDNSDEWQFIPDDEKAAIGLDFSGDGEFYMSEQDFRDSWKSFELCHLDPDSMDDDDEKTRWHRTQERGEWTAGQSAGGCRNNLETFASNPQFKVVLEDSDDDDDSVCTLLVSLMQIGTRKKKAMVGKGALAVGFIIYQLEDDSVLPLDTDFFRYHASVGRSASFINLREVTGRFKLPPGSYVIVPSTFEPDEEGEFLLRVFSEKASQCDRVH